VRAPANGQVALVGKESDGFMLHGNCVGLNHGQGVTSMLMHLDSAWVQ
jgi:murein DD-endopeptidase MepM/ murein hydrolase activator NlpD